MKRIGSALVIGLNALAAVPAWAQQASPAPGMEPWGEWHHMGGWHAGWFLAPFVMLLALVGVVVLIVLLVGVVSRHHHGAQGCPRCGYGRPAGRSAGDALAILEERFARGEIGKDEFEEKRRLIGR